MGNEHSVMTSSGLRPLKRRLVNFNNGFRDAIYPTNIHSLWVVTAIPAGLHFTGRRMPFDLTNKVLEFMPGQSTFWNVIGCCVSGLLVWLPLCITIKCSAKLLFSYTGFFYEARGRPVSTQTKLWAATMKMLTWLNRPLLYSFQSLQPTMPVPPVKETMTRYLRSMRPLLDDENYERVTNLAKEFETGLGKKLQRYLIVKSLFSNNYVSDWWEEYVYLRCRGPLMVKSNFFGTTIIFDQPSKVQAARAANYISLLLRFRDGLDNQSQQSIMVQGVRPLCSNQYKRVFNTLREPGFKTDRIVHYENSDHIVVLHKGCYYKVLIFHRNRLLKPCEIQLQLEYILNNDAKSLPGEELLASLTAGDRTKWAEMRTVHLSEGINKTALHTVETAAFFVSLDDYTYGYDPKDSSVLDNYASLMLHGKGHDRWFDKSFCLCISTNGMVGFNTEHTWADAPIISHCMEWAAAEDLFTDCYDHNGNCKGTPDFEPPMPTRITWYLRHPRLMFEIEQADIAAQKLINDVDLRILVHRAFGKGVMKKCRLSPDAFIQMALQLAYFRDQGKFSLTYEASMTRLFRDGRTETVRSCTNESTAWVRAMCKPDRNINECVKLLQAACEQHQTGYRDAMCGKGVDRHLFCLYVVSKYLEVDSPFLNEVLSVPWLLSTSQTPHDQTSKLDKTRNPNSISAGGGFGPVDDNGYGVSYMIAGEDIVFFHVASSNSCPDTDTGRFQERITEALKDVKELYEEYERQRKPIANGNGTVKH